MNTDEHPARTSLTIPWYAVPNDLIGGWCIMTENHTPSHMGIDKDGNWHGGYTIADLRDEHDARHIVALHNATLRRADEVQGAGY